MANSIISKEITNRQALQLINECGGDKRFIRLTSDKVDFTQNTFTLDIGYINSQVLVANTMVSAMIGEQEEILYFSFNADELGVEIEEMFVDESPSSMRKECKDLTINDFTATFE